MILSTYDVSPSQVWFINHVAREDHDSIFYKMYKAIFVNQLKKHNIKEIYVVKPMWGGNDILEKSLNKSCYSKKQVTEILDSYLLIADCDDLP